MAPKDYVKRKPQARKKNTRASSAKQTQTVGSTPWLRIVLALFIIGGFVWGLYQLQQSDMPNDAQRDVNNGSVNTSQNETNKLSDTDSSPTLEVIEDIKDAVPPLPPLPVLGEEEWEYIDALPEASVEVDATGPVESDREYIMQCGSFRTPERAEELKARLALVGFESRVIESNGGKWHRVVLGPYENKRDAERDRHALRRNNIQRCKIW